MTTCILYNAMCTEPIIYNGMHGLHTHESVKGTLQDTKCLMHLHRPLIPKLCAVTICINCIRALGIPDCNFKTQRRHKRALDRLFTCM